jgi:hypothetical protein
MTIREFNRIVMGAGRLLVDLPEKSLWRTSRVAAASRRSCGV